MGKIRTNTKSFEVRKRFGKIGKKILNGCQWSLASY